MATPTKTINPLHFEDLEPLRFEDMVRQLVYDFRDWSSIEAVGQLGADEGIDIRAVEQIAAVSSPSDLDAEDEDDLEPLPIHHKRVWNIQCKRERSIPPKKVEQIVSDDLSRQEQIQYGYGLAPPDEE